MATIEGQDPERGARAAMALHEAAITAGECMTDGVMERRDVQGVRANARWLVGMCEKPLGEKHPDDTEEVIWRKHTAVAIGHFRTQLKERRDRCVSLSISAQHPAERYAAQAVAQARLDATVEMAELLLRKEDFRLLMDALGLTPHYLR